MKAAAFFAAADRLPIGTLADIVASGGLVVVAPHPDDESLGCGGLIATACSHGVDVRLIVVSDGVGSHPNSRRYPAARLRLLREEETYSSAAALGLDADAIRFLRLPDRSVPTQGSDAQAAAALIAASALAVKANAICVTWRHDPHCDHTASATLVEHACARLDDIRTFAYPIWGRTLGDDAEVGSAPRGLRLDIRPHLPAKAAAIAAHRSQTTDLIDDDPKGFRLSPTMIERFLQPYELLLETAPRVTAP